MSISPNRDPSPSANDRFKSRWNRALWSATALGVVFHVGLLFQFPDFRVDGPARDEVDPARLIHLVNLSEIALAPDPAEIAIVVPSLPTIDPLDLDIALDEPFVLPDFDDFAPDDRNLRPPVRTTRDEWLDYKAFAPYVVRPEIRNRTELKRFLQRSYQRIYEYSGETGVVQVSFWIDEGGMVEKAEIAESSGSRSLDRLALRLSRVLRFRPAMMAGRPIRILVHMPITFRAA